MMGLCVCSMSCVRVVQFSSLCPQAGYKVSGGVRGEMMEGRMEGELADQF